MDKTILDECWEWKGSRDPGGYGAKKIHGKQYITHRLAWAWANGPIPPGMFVCHRCDNPPCCNPAHLFLGTVTDNNRDMVAKRRQVNNKKTHCKRGHELVDDNVRVRPCRPTHRECKECGRLRARKQLPTWDYHPMNEYFARNESHDA